QEAEDRGRIGHDSFGVAFNDAVKVEVKLTRPAYLYLVAFNADGSEQLLWPGPQDRPAARDQLTFPVREDRWFFLDDNPRGGMQAFAVLASNRRLPAYAEWQAARGRRPGGGSSRGQVCGGSRTTG